MNRFGGATGEDLKYWNSSYSPGDVGSRITFVEFTDEQIENMLFADVLNVLKSEGCVGGYTAEQLAGVRAAYNAKDITTAQDAVAALEGAFLQQEFCQTLIKAPPKDLFHQPHDLREPGSHNLVGEIGCRS